MKPINLACISKEHGEYVHALENENRKYEKEITDLKDKLHRRNMQIAELKKYKDQCFELSALLGRLGYNLKGEKVNVKS